MLTTDNHAVGIEKNLNNFKPIESNRKVAQFDSTVLTNLIESIKKTQGIISPIVVDKDFRVVDGQHRLAALKHINESRVRTDKEPYGAPYFMHKKIDYRQAMIESNSNSRTWSLGDFINYYNVVGNPEIQKLVEVLPTWCKKYAHTEEDEKAETATPKAKFTLLVVTLAFSSTASHNVQTLITQEKYKFNKEKGERLLEAALLLSYTPAFKTRFKHKHAIAALDLLYAHSNMSFTPETLFDAMNKFAVQPSQVDVDPIALSKFLALYYNRMVSVEEKIVFNW